MSLLLSKEQTKRKDFAHLGGGSLYSQYGAVSEVEGGGGE
jgi:hypothetical protein